MFNLLTTTAPNTLPSSPQTLQLLQMLQSYSTSSIKLATTPPPPQLPTPSNGTRQRTSTVWRHSLRDEPCRGSPSARVSRQNSGPKKVLRWRGAREENRSTSARCGCKKRPVTVTREAEGRRRVRSRLAERGCDAPEGGGARRELVSE